MNIRPAFLRLSVVLGTLMWLGLGVCEEAGARAGGAGGRSSGSRSSSRSSGGSSRSSGGSYRSSGGGGFYRVSGSDAGWFKWLFLGVGVVVLVIIIRRAMEANEEEMPLLPSPPAPVGEEAFLAANPDFDPALFKGKVRSAFLKIQEAWAAQDISQIRPFISDGMYQRFATQFRMMGLLKQRNVIENVRIFGVHPVFFRTDGAFDAIDVWVGADMTDSFTCELDPSMNSQGGDPFVEYWSFIRKRGAADSGFNLFAAQNCPSCGAELPRDMGELCRCSHCQVLVNSGEFDWVLAEITQEGDYGRYSRMGSRVSPELPDAIAAVAPEAPDFSQQLAEDKASNAFMQIMTAYATKKPASVRRFVTDELFGSISANISPDRTIIFNRIYLNESVLLDVTRDEGESKHRLAVGLSASMQRVELLSGGRLALVDSEEQRTNFVLSMERDIHAVPEKGSLYQHQCANCGGRVGDSIDVNCQYCGSPLNSTRNEWIVCGFGES
ncbi:TIM44-like domain-containing protein [Luteolibacter soli]|uniref:TIM44-like domain-containing protein n=1 Tax=Luteolibacter soli TaxID=3135280 RepID=A0ABU9B061_9BACT